MLEFPAGAPVMVSVEELPAVTDAGLNEQVAPEGQAFTLSAIVPLKEFTAVVETV